MMPPQYMGRSTRGKSGVSFEIGATIQKETTIHDDGIMHFGGISALISGPMGGGKTTYLIQAAGAVGYMPDGLSKESYDRNTPINPETVIWRGRKYDYWNSMIKSNWIKSFPHSPVLRRVIVHIHEEDDLSFFEKRQPDKEMIFDGDELDYLTYQNAKDLYRNLKIGEINVVYEPTNYFLKEEVIEEMIKQTLEDLRLARLKRKSKKKKKSEEDELEINEDNSIQAPSPVFWYEFLETIMEIKKREEYFSVFIDEAHQVARMNPPGELYHLGNWLANSMIDFRRNNLSLFLASQDIQLLDYRIVDRVLYFFWLPGARVYPRISRMQQSLVDTLIKGEVVAELSRQKFGRINFKSIPYQPPVVYVKGLKAST